MKRTIFCITILSVCLSGSVTFGIAPIGQPATNLRKSLWRAGAEYSSTNMDLNVDNFKNMSFFSDSTLENVDIELLLGKAGYGITNFWEVFAGLGAARTNFGDHKNYVYPWGDSGYIGTDNYNVDGDVSFAAQIGTKFTFYEKALIKAGVTCQYTWLNLTGSIEQTTTNNNDYLSIGKTDIDTDLMILQVAPGVSYQLLYGVSVYGGPLFQWINGKINSDGKTGQFVTHTGSADIKTDSSYGGWVGLQADIDIYTSFNVEYQMTGSSSTIGLSLSSKF